ncbi:hypothetical protein Tco_0837136 [Tanacetum coccineum]
MLTGCDRIVSNIGEWRVYGSPDDVYDEPRNVKVEDDEPDQMADEEWIDLAEEAEAEAEAEKEVKEL